MKLTRELVLTHRVEVDLADLVKLVPVGVGLMHHCALQMNLCGGKGQQEVLSFQTK